jgi:Tol biopolymer transport system component
MPLSPATRFGAYEIVALIGEGGMGEVYRARDTRLDRDVAIKVLPAALADNAERVARFEREAKVLAALNHPNIAAIYGFEDGAIVMELVDGPTFADRIKSRPLPLDEALAIASQIADALEAAHEKGIVHRDLKPANIKVTPEGAVKVLDFGLAAMAHDEIPANSLATTLTVSPSRTGIIMGRAAYMSPEQARGQKVDRRADVWAFGVVLFEMLAGRQLFIGETMADTLAAVLRETPDWERVPREVRRLLRACLEKDPRRRLQSIGDWRLPLGEPTPQVPSPLRSRSGYGAIGWIAASVALIALLVLSFVHFREARPQGRTQRYTIATPEKVTVQSVAISPDGRYIVLAGSVNGNQQLWLRPLDALQFQPMPGTDGANSPIWSPDSRFLGFAAQGKLKKIAVTGGPAQTLCDIQGFIGGSWNRDNVIIFPPGGKGIQRVPARGGALPAEVGKIAGLPGYPVFLPDDRHFLYVQPSASREGAGIYLASLDGKENRRLLANVSRVTYSPAPDDPSKSRGYLLFIRENTLMAQPFDARKLQLSGDAFPVAEGAGTGFSFGIYVPLSASENGVLLYTGGGTAGNGGRIVWYDRGGKVIGPAVKDGNAADPSLSPDEKSMVFTRVSGASRDIWLRDLVRRTDRPLTSGNQSLQPVWSPKGDRIAYRVNRGVPGDIYEKPVDGSGEEQLVLTTPNFKVPNQWSRDGRFIVYHEGGGTTTQRDVWVLPVDDRGRASGEPFPFVQSQSNETDGQLSPDSLWMAYVSDESGQNEVYVRPFPSGKVIGPISTAGGVMPRWRGDGKEMFYISGDKKMMAVPVVRAQPSSTAGGKPVFDAGTPAPLFDVNLANPDSLPYQYDVTADGKHFLVNTSSDDTASSPPLIVVVNWNGSGTK